MEITVQSMETTFKDGVPSNLTIAEAQVAAAEVGHPVSLANLRHACRTHRLDARRFGQQWMIGHQTLFAWLQNPLKHKTGKLGAAAACGLETNEHVGEQGFRAKTLNTLTQHWNTTWDKTANADREGMVLFTDPYTTICEAHGTMHGDRRLAAAKLTREHPETWCISCADKEKRDAIMEAIPEHGDWKLPGNNTVSVKAEYKGWAIYYASGVPGEYRTGLVKVTTLDQVVDWLIEHNATI